MIEAKIQINPRSALLKSAASEFGPDTIKEHDAVIPALQQGDVEAARTAAGNLFERAADRLAARDDFA